MYVEGAEVVQPVSLAAGGSADSVILYPVTLTLSDAVKAVIGILMVVEGDVAVKVSTVGGVASIWNRAIRSALKSPPASINAPPAYRSNPLMMIALTVLFKVFTGVAPRADQALP